MSPRTDPARRWTLALIYIVGATVVFVYVSQGRTDPWSLRIGYAIIVTYYVHFLLYGFGKGGIIDVLEKAWRKLHGRGGPRRNQSRS